MIGYMIAHNYDPVLGWSLFVLVSVIILGLVVDLAGRGGIKR